MTSHERQLFLEIAPNYLSYIRRALETGQPTLLGKIVGMYHLSYRGVANTTAVKSNFLVMENLFYGRTITQRFDLKGSMRNRLVETTLSAGDSVLLDENLLKSKSTMFTGHRKSLFKY
jgi:1-phosphatidylinositol-3-phosphate 5-kinase